jgi:thiamine pyrophosphokinase
MSATVVRALVLADGDPPSRAGLDETWPGWATDVSIVVAADGGARSAGDLGVVIGHWVGDGDSTSPADLDRLRAAGVSVDLVPADKDESDTELAVLAAIARGATDVTIVGALGGPRVDHELANVALLAHPALAGRPARLLDPRARISLLDGPAEGRFDGRPGDRVSLLPLDGAVIGITTTGLAYALDDETLPIGPPRGLSNVRTGPSAAIRVRDGRLLVVESPANLSS